MKSRPISLTLLALLFVGLASGLPLQVMLIYGHGFNELNAVFAKLTLLNDLVIIGLLAGAVLLWRAARYTRSILAYLTGLVALNNFFVGFYATDFSPLVAGVASVGFAFVNLPLFNKRLIWLFKHPEQRWWLHAARHRVSVPVVIEGTQLPSMKSETFDLSESGVFVPMTHDLGIGERIDVRMTFGSLAQVRYQGRVVRRNTAGGNYPAGVGIEFTDMSWGQRRELKRHLQNRSFDL